MSDETKRQKCNRCKVNLTLDKFKKKRDDSYTKNCIECNVKYNIWRHTTKCEHGKLPSRCKQCGGGSICLHNKRRDNCYECGANICEHNKRKSCCVECGGSQICPHYKKRSQCVECGGSGICPHSKQRGQCKLCNSPIFVTIKNMIRHSKESDKKCDRYDANNFIDKCFLEGLIEEYPNCYYDDCKVELQYIEYQDNLATIERLDNSIGHIKSNCVICCMKCNFMKKSNK